MLKVLEMLPINGNVVSKMNTNVERKVDWAMLPSFLYVFFATCSFGGGGGRDFGRTEFLLGCQAKPTVHKSSYRNFAVQIFIKRVVCVILLRPLN